MKIDADPVILGHGVTRASAPGLLAVTAAALVALLVIFRATVMPVVELWIHSDIYQHGVVVVPIALWLAWRARATVPVDKAKPWWPAALAIAAMAFLWLLGALASVLSVQQFALVAMLQATIVLVLGVPVARSVAFPIAFLFFTVPIGDFLVQPMTDWTADVTIAALKASGVPVFREGNDFIIPSGSWSVVEGCNGMRYLIASVMVGVLYAHLNYRSLGRRLAFVAASIVVPIIANWVRAYAIVMIGHLSNNKLAAGADHLVYGWVLFGVVMMVLFWIGSRWREDLPEAGRAPGGPATDAARSSGTRTALAVFGGAAAVAVGVAALGPVASAALGSRVSAAPVALPALEGRGGWVSSPELVAPWTPIFVGERATLHQAFRAGETKVGVYIAYYRNQRQDEELVNFRNMLVSTKDHSWRRSAHGRTEISWNGQPVSVEQSELVSSKGRLQVLKFYSIDGRVTANDYLATALLALGKLAGRGDDAAAIVLYAPVLASGARGKPELDAFIAGMAPAIDRALAAARESGR